MQPYRVVHIIPALPIGGAERCVVNIINAASADVEHHIILFTDIMPFAAALTRPCHVSVVQKKGKAPWRFLRELRAEIRHMAPDIIHTHLFGADLWGRVAARGIAPIVSTEHNVNYGESTIAHLLKRLLRGLSARYIAPSQAIAAYMRAEYGIDETQIAHIPYGVDVSCFLSAPVPTFQGTLRRLVFLGRLVPQKGVDTLLLALARHAHEPWQLDIYGEGQEKEYLEALTSSLLLQDRVHFFPFTDDVAGTLTSYEVLLMPSRYEGFGILALEGMAAGRAVFASAVDGLCELIDSGATGQLVPPTVEGWGGALSPLFAPQAGEALRRMAFAGRDRVQAEYDISRMVRGYESLYADILHRA
jgi:glycosyltransferase involved in cell wall biosynthesis